MKDYFTKIKCGSPFFVYICSLFVLTNILGTLCSNIISFIAFLVFSVVYIFLTDEKAVSANLYEGRSGPVISVFCIITLLFSVFYESKIITDTFSVVSDAESENWELAVFAAVIISVSFVCSLYGTNTLIRASNIVFFLTFIVAIPCILSLIQFGTVSISDFLSTSNPVYDLILGFVAFAVFISQYGILSRNFRSYSNSGKRYSKLLTLASLIYILILGIIQRLLLGEILFGSLSSPLFAIAGTTKILKFDEILLLIYSVLAIFRTACIITFIINELNRHLSNKKFNSVTACITVVICGASGVLLLNGHNIVYAVLTLQFLNLMSYVILPYIFSKFRKIK